MKSVPVGIIGVLPKPNTVYNRNFTSLSLYTKERFQRRTKQDFQKAKFQTERSSSESRKKIFLQLLVTLSHM